MHEASLLKDLMNKIMTVAETNASQHVIGVKVRLGALAHISEEHFREHFERIAEGTIAAGARLDIDISSDMTDPHAQDILLESVELEE